MSGIVKEQPRRISRGFRVLRDHQGDVDGFWAGQGLCQGGAITGAVQEDEEEWAVPVFSSPGGCQKPELVFKGLIKTSHLKESLWTDPAGTLNPHPQLGPQMPEKGACMTALVSPSGNKTL